MAKELPYFQFEPAEYLTKDISFCSLAAQGLFINICSYYWQRACNLTKDQILKRLNYEEELNELINEGVIDLVDDNLIIKFLDIQYKNATKLSLDNSRKGKLGGAKKGNQNARKTSQKQPENNPKTSHKIREDKIIEDNIKEEVVKKDINDIEIEFDKSTFKDIEDLKKYYLTDLRLRNAFCSSNNFQDSKLHDRLNQFNNHLESQSRFKETFNEYAKHFLSWHRKAPDNKNGYQKKQKVNAGELLKQKYGIN